MVREHAQQLRERRLAGEEPLAASSAIADPRAFNGIKVDDLFSIAVNKIACLGRREPKDYVDLYLILQSGRYTVQDLIPRAKEKELGPDELTIGADFHAVDTLPHLIAVPALGDAPLK